MALPGLDAFFTLTAEQRGPLLLEGIRASHSQLSIPLPQDRRSSFRRRYSTMEGLLAATERAYAGLGLEMVTSSGTSGVASVVARGAALVFVMPENTRVAMARSARFGTRQLDWAAGTAVYYTMPFSATPDRIRLRIGHLTGAMDVATCSS